MLYVVLGHWIARSGAEKGIDTLGAAMCVALVAITPIGLCGAVSAFANPTVLFAGVVVGLSVVASFRMSAISLRSRGSRDRVLRSCFPLLPLTATIVGIVILHQIPSHRDVAGVILVMTGVALHRVGDSV